MLLTSVMVVVLAREHHAEQPVTIAADEEYRPVLAHGVVLLERHPGPHDLAGVGLAVRLRRVRDGRHATEVARVAPAAVRRRRATVRRWEARRRRRPSA